MYRVKQVIKKLVKRLIGKRISAPTPEVDKFIELKNRGGLSPSRLVNKGQTVVHLGVWRSETIELWSNLVGADGKVVIVEADDLNHMINTVEVKRRMLNNVLLVNKAIWNKKQNVTLQVSDISMRNKLRETQAIDRLNPDTNYNVEKVVEADTLDNILADLGIEKVDHVYMTISGAEMEALGGMENVIKKNKRLSIYIRSILLNSNNELKSMDVVNYLTQLGFKAKAAPKEKNRDGSNIYAGRYEA